MATPIEVLDHTTLGPADVLVLRVDAQELHHALDFLQQMVIESPELSNRILVTTGEFEVIRGLGEDLPDG